MCIYACPSCCRDHHCCCYSCCSPALRNWRCRRQGCSKGASYSQRRLSESGGVVTTAVRVWNSLWSLAEKEGRQERWRRERGKKRGVAPTVCFLLPSLFLPPHCRWKWHPPLYGTAQRSGVGDKTAARTAFVTTQPKFGRGGCMCVNTALLSLSLSLRLPFRGQGAAEVMETQDAVCLSRFWTQRLLLNNPTWRLRCQRVSNTD